jgi:hypothetical protein
MNKFTLISILILNFFTGSSSYLTDNKELRRQYEDYLNIFKKSETPRSFEYFVESLQRIEQYNSDFGTNKCKMYLTQHSDLRDGINDFSFKKC